MLQKEITALNHPYAQTSVQLFNQIREARYSTSELDLILRSYRHALKLFACRYQASGKLFMAHVIGTASILSYNNAPIDLVAAGLLHNAYWNGNFGFGNKGVSEAKRKVLRAEVGEEVERNLYAFSTLVWGRKTLHNIYQNLQNFEHAKQNAVKMYLADALEHHLDLGVLYYEDIDQRIQYIREYGDIIVEISQKVNMPSLADDLRVTFNAVLQKKPIKQFMNPIDNAASYIIAPGWFTMTYWKRLCNQVRRLYVFTWRMKQAFVK